MTIKTLFPFILFLLLYACNTAEESFKIENSIAQLKLEKELVKLNITFRVGNDGHIWFSPKDSEAVHKAAFRLMENVTPESTTLRYDDSKYTDLLIDKLNDIGAPYSTEYREGILFVSLKYKDKALWLPAKLEVDNIIIHGIKGDGLGIKGTLPFNIEPTNLSMLDFPNNT